MLIGLFWCRNLNLADSIFVDFYNHKASLVQYYYDFPFLVDIKRVLMSKQSVSSGWCFILLNFVQDSDYLLRAVPFNSKVNLLQGSASVSFLYWASILIMGSTFKPHILVEKLVKLNSSQQSIESILLESIMKISWLTLL